MAAYAATVARKNRVVSKIAPGIGLLYGTCNVTNYNSTLAEITGITNYFQGKAPVVTCDAQSDSGYAFEWNVASKAFKAYYSGGSDIAASTGAVADDNNAATVGHALYVVPDPGASPFTLVAEGSSSAEVNDNDNAATDGVQVYVVIDDVEFLPGFNLGHLEFVSPTNAHGTCTLKTGVTKTLLIADDDAAATNGTELKVQAAAAGLISDMAGTNRTLVPLSDGTYLDVEDGTGGSPVAVYFDEDGANTYERLESVVVDNAQEPISILEVSHLKHRGVPSQSITAKLVSVSPHGTMTIGAVGSGGPQFRVLHDAAAAEMPGAATLNTIAAGGGFDAAVGGEQDVYIPTTTGEFIKVTYAASPTGVQVYWDADATNNYERLTAVVVDNANESYTTETSIGMLHANVAGSEVADDVDVGLVHFHAIGPVN